MCWSPQRTQGQSPLLGYGHSTVSIARPALGVEFSIAKLMFIQSLSPGLLCSWVTEKRQRWLSRMLTFIVEAVIVTWSLKSLSLSFSFLLIHMEHKYLPILFPKTSIYILSSRLFFSWILQLCPWSFHQTIGHISWIGIELVISIQLPLLLGKNKQAVNLTEALPFTENQVHVPNTQGGYTRMKGQGVGPRKLYWGPCKERNISCLKNLKLSESSQWSPFLGRWGRGMVSYLNILVSEPLFWRSGHGQVTVPLNISWVSVSVLTRKGRSCGMAYPPGSSPGWVRAQLESPQGWVLSPYSAIIAEEAGHPSQLALRLLCCCC